MQTSSYKSVVKLISFTICVLSKKKRAKAISLSQSPSAYSLSFLSQLFSISQPLFYPFLSNFLTPQQFILSLFLNQRLGLRSLRSPPQNWLNVSQLCVSRKTPNLHLLSFVSSFRVLVSFWEWEESHYLSLCSCVSIS